ncbi:DUF481 domain-containing protein [Thiohalocapsa marina]|nr:DUF481 domain-containing protein [Thiohalocapsa marina]
MDSKASRNLLGAFGASLLLTSLGLCRPALADQVLLHNGDRLSGSVLRQAGTQLRLQTAYAGVLVIDWSQVREVRLDEPAEVLLADETLVQNKYTRSFPRTRWYGAAWLDLEHDRFADIRLRYHTGPAVGYRLLEGGASRLRAEIGPVYLTEDYYSNLDQDFWGSGLFLDYEQDLWGEALELYHRNVAFVAATDSKNLRTSRTGLRVPLVAGFIDPTTETKTTDTTLGLKLGYRC